LSLTLYESKIPRRIFGSKRKWQEAGEEDIMRSFINILFTKYSDDEIKED
jgi:hypothetical protein